MPAVRPTLRPTLLPTPHRTLLQPRRPNSSSSSSRWLARKAQDPYSKAAKLSNLRARSAFKLLELHTKHRLFKPAQTVIDLGFAPGSWSQIALEATKPGGRILGVDLIPAQPPRGVSSIQGNFLDAGVRDMVKEWVRAEEQGEGDQEQEQESYIERAAAHEAMRGGEQRRVDVVLSDMCAPWSALAPSPSKRSVRAAFDASRLMNTSGLPLRDHLGSIALCNAALRFCLDCLKPGGSLVAKFYRGEEERAMVRRLEKCFGSVKVDKPASSAKESRENYFVAMRMRKIEAIDREAVEKGMDE